MKKAGKMIWLLPLLLVFLLGAGRLSGEQTLASGLSEGAEVLLFAPVNDTHVLAYTDDTTEIRLADGSASATTVFAANAVFLNQNSLSAMTALEDFLVIERLDAETLQQTDFYTVEIPQTTLKYYEMDRYARFYACPAVVRCRGQCGRESGVRRGDRGHSGAGRPAVCVPPRAGHRSCPRGGDRSGGWVFVSRGSSRVLYADAGTVPQCKPCGVQHSRRCSGAYPDEREVHRVPCRG